MNLITTDNLQIATLSDIHVVMFSGNKISGKNFFNNFKNSSKE